MLNVKTIIRQDKANDKGEAPIVIRLTANRDVAQISFGHKIHIDHWDHKMGRPKKIKNINYNHLANRIADFEKRVYQINDELLEFNGNVTVWMIKAKLKGNSNQNFYAIAERYISTLKRIGTIKGRNSVIKKLKDNRPKLFINEISVPFLNDYEKYLRDVRNNGVNTIHSNMKVIRAIINFAIREGVFNKDRSPFPGYRMKTKPTNKVYLKEEELLKIYNLDIPKDTPLFHHKNAFVFAAYAGGLRISDLCKLKWENFDGEFLNLIVKKTGDQLSLKVPKRGLEILKYYEETTKKEGNDLIFPILKADYAEDNVIGCNKITSAHSIYNENLKRLASKAEIKKSISSHVARHSFGTLALSKGVGIAHVSKLMGHTSIKQTMVYVKFIDEDLVKAMDKFDL